MIGLIHTKTSMWFLGFSTNNRRNLWILGAILLVILVTIILRKFAVYLGALAQTKAIITSSSKSESLQRADLENGYPLDKDMLCSGGLIRTYTLEELKMATSDFRIRIGVGATSFVYLAELGDGTFGAVKRVMKERGGSRKIFFDEVSVLLRISHPNLVGLLGFCSEQGEQLLLLEYVPKKSLFDRLHTHYGQSLGVLSWWNRLNIALDTARALHYLHSQADPPVIHRDVKSSNILLTDNNHAKLADFGLCKLGHDPQVSPISVKGSIGYVDTNYLKTGRVSPKSDVYSYGVLLLELMTGLKSTQGSVTLAEWTAGWRKTDDKEVFGEMLDPKLKVGDADPEQVRLLVHLANSALLENAEARPDMSTIVEGILSCMEAHPHDPDSPV